MSGDPWFIYVAENRRNDTLKIGVSTNPLHRILGLRNRYHDMWLLGYELGSHYRERQVLALFSGARLCGEWFRDVPEIRKFASELKCEEIQLFRHLPEDTPGTRNFLEAAQRQFMREVSIHLTAAWSDRRAGATL